MSVVTEISPDGQKLTISIRGRFDFGRHQEFRESYERLNRTPDVNTFIQKRNELIDRLQEQGVNTLLLLRDHAGGDNADVRVINSNSDVRKILAISNFDKLFDIS